MESLSGAQNSGPEEDRRKRKRMESNRESARRSRVRKQKHLDDLTAEISRMSKENNQISISVNVTAQHCVSVEAQNSVLRAQMMELTQRLHSLNEILDFIHCSAAAAAEAEAAAAAVGGCVFGAEGFQHQGFADNQQHPIMASAEMIDYY
ncbi:hypothetical protein ABFX02_14G044400 [Erythranthe guttata]